MTKLQQRLLTLILISLCSTAQAAGQTAASATTTTTTAPASAATTAPATVKATATKATTEQASPAPATQIPSTTKVADPATSDQSATTEVYADLPQQAPLTKDPYEGFNRAMFTFNDKLDKFIMKPIAKGYNTIMPRPLNQGVHNFYNNLGTLPTLANDLLQFNFYQAANDTWRILVNTTVGVGGLFDVASRIGLPYYSNDFGLTMAAWGYENSNYLVLPFFGPSTPRDGIGIPVDYFAFSIYPYINPQSTRYQVYGLGVVDRRAQLLKFQEVLEEASIDKYVFIRNAYMQRRAHQIEENQHLGYADRNTNQPVAATVSSDTAVTEETTTTNDNTQTATTEGAGPAA